MSAEPADVRVMSSNVRLATPLDGRNAWQYRKGSYLETVRAFGPDLLRTQETLAPQRDDLLAGLPGYACLAAGRDDGRERGEMMALFYREARFERLDGGHFWLSDDPERPGSKSWGGSLPRMVTWAQLRDLRDPDGPPVAAFNTHFDHVGGRARLESARLLRERVASVIAGCRVVVTGDFNCGEDSEPYRALFDGGHPRLVDTLRTTRPERGPEEGTFSGFRARNTRGDRIDWIAVSADWEVVGASIDRSARGGRTPSDHFPVTAILRPGPG